MAELWTPANLPALVAWYAADEPLNAVADGLVSALHDKSGHGNHMTVVGGTAAKRARLFDDALGGRPAWGADGASATAQFSTSGPRLMQAGSAARGLAIIAVTSAVIEHGSTPGGIAMLSRGGNATAGRVQLATGYVASGVFYGAGRRADTDSNLNYNNGSKPTGWVIASASNDYINRTGELYLDGAQSGRRTDFHTGGHTSTTDSVAAWLGTTSSAAAHPYSGKTAEVLFCGDALTDADRQRLEGYLAHKYGKTADLPADHPYRATPPMADVYQDLTVPAVSAWAHITEPAPGVRRHALDADTLRRPASTTKFLSAQVARQWVSDALLDTTVTVISADVVGGSTMGLQAGDIVTYRDLFHGLMLPSGNDAAACLGRSVGNLIATAEGGSGGLTRFVAAMNARLASLGGSSGATFVDASGLSVDNVCTPADMAKIIWAFGGDDFLRQVGSAMSYTASVAGTNPRTLTLAHNAAPWASMLPEMRAIKTGTLRPTGANAPKSAGGCLGMLWQDASGEDRVTVVFAAASDPARYEDMRRLVDFDVALAALTPPVTGETATGEVAALSLSAPSGAASTSTSASGTVALLRLSAPSGYATTASTTFASGDLAALSIAAPDGTSAAQTAASAGIPDLTLTAPAGDASSASTTFAAGDVAQISLAAPTGTTAQSAASSGAVQHVSLTAPNGSVMIGAEMVAAGDIAPIGISAVGGATLAVANAAGAVRYLTISAPVGTASDGLSPAFDLRGSVFARVPAGYGVLARIR